MSGRRWQPDQLKTQSSDQVAGSSIRSRLELFMFQSSQNESIDFRARPLFILDGGSACFFQRLEGPVTFACDGVRRSSELRRDIMLGCGSSHFDPRLEFRDRFVGNLLLGGHLEIRVGVAYRLN